MASKGPLVEDSVMAMYIFFSLIETYSYLNVSFTWQLNTAVCISILQVLQLVAELPAFCSCRSKRIFVRPCKKMDFTRYTLHSISALNPFLLFLNLIMFVKKNIIGGLLRLIMYCLVKKHFLSITKK